MRSFSFSRASNAAILSFSVVLVGGMKPKSPDALRSLLYKVGRPLSSFHVGDTVTATHKKYSYRLDSDPGVLQADFKPELTPAEMLMVGVFEGTYLNDCYTEFPAEWFLGGLMTGRLSPGHPDAMLNCFGIKSRQPLSVWKENGWAPTPGHTGNKNHYKGALSDPRRNPDERGWFQWYCRYWMGRRIPDLDALQIRRWRAFTRHAGAIRANCKKGDLTCRPRERQALLQWAWSPFI